MDITDIHILDYVEKNPAVNYLVVRNLNNRLIMVFDTLVTVSPSSDRTYMFVERDASGITRTVAFSFTSSSSLTAPRITFFNNAYYVIVPTERTIWRINATSFALDTINFPSFSPQGIISNNNAIVVFGGLGNGTANDARIASSSDGTTFTTIPVTSTELWFYAGLWNGSQFLIFGQDRSLFLGNSSATSFTIQATTGLSGIVLSDTLVYSGVAYLLRAGGSLYRSTDFLTWTVVSLSLTSTFSNLVWAPSTNQFLLATTSTVYVSDSAGLVWTSTDVSNYLFLQDIAALQTYYYLIGNNTLLVGSNLSNLNILSSVEFSKRLAQWVINRYVLFITRLNSSQVTFSNDFYTWADAVTTNLPVSDAYIAFIEATDGNNKIIRGNLNFYYASGITNWTNWVVLTISAGVTINSIIFGNNIFVAVGNAGAIWTSPTGANGSWTSRTSGTTNQLNFVRWTGSVFIAIGAAGTILRSSDGITWTLITSGTTNILRSCSNSTTSILIVGASGVVLRSTDNGLTFNLSSFTTGNLSSILFANSIYYLIISGKFSSSNYYSSDDGLNFISFRINATSFFDEIPSTKNASNGYSINAGNWLVIDTIATNTGNAVL